MAAADTFLPAIEKAKQISVYRNGDDKFPGKRIIVNKRKIANFDVFLDEVTQCLRPRCGAIQRLYTPVNGHRITDLDSVIKRGENFVAAGKEKFHKLGYLEIEVSPRKRSNKGFLEIRPVRHSRIQTSGRIKKVQTEPIIIFVHPNGYNLDGPHRIQLRRREQGSWDLVYDAIKERVSLVTGGAIRKLYTLEGHPVHSVHEIENLGCYVACGKEAFKDIDYNQPKPPMYSPRLERRKYQHGQKLTPLSQSQRTSKKGSQNNSINRTPESINGSLNSRQHKARRKVKKEDQVIHERPVAYKRNSQPDDKTKEINYDQDPGGVFRAQRQNPSTRGAAEVTEDRETRVDVPVDQRRAEVVEEYIKSENGGRGRRRPSQSSHYHTMSHSRSSSRDRSLERGRKGDGQSVSGGGTHSDQLRERPDPSGREPENLNYADHSSARSSQHRGTQKKHRETVLSAETEDQLLENSVSARMMAHEDDDRRHSHSSRKPGGLGGGGRNTSPMYISDSLRRASHERRLSIGSTEVTDSDSSDPARKDQPNSSQNTDYRSFKENGPGSRNGHKRTNRKDRRVSIEVSRLDSDDRHRAPRTIDHGAPAGGGSPASPHQHGTSKQRGRMASLDTPVLESQKPFRASRRMDHSVSEQDTNSESSEQEKQYEGSEIQQDDDENRWNERRIRARNVVGQLQSEAEKQLNEDPENYEETQRGELPEGRFSRSLQAKLKSRRMSQGQPTIHDQSDTRPATYTMHDRPSVVNHDEDSDTGPAPVKRVHFSDPT